MTVNKKFDSMPLGLISGLVLPVLSLLVIWLIRFDGGLLEFLSSFQRMSLLSKVLSLAAIPNLLLFFLFIWTNRTYSARGVIFGTLVVAMVMLAIKFA